MEELFNVKYKLIIDLYFTLNSHPVIVWAKVHKPVFKKHQHHQQCTKVHKSVLKKIGTTNTVHHQLKFIA